MWQCLTTCFQNACQLEHVSIRTGIFYAVVRQISMLFIDNKISVFCIHLVGIFLIIMNVGAVEDPANISQRECEDICQPECEDISRVQSGDSGFFSSCDSRHVFFV